MPRCETCGSIYRLNNRHLCAFDQGGKATIGQVRERQAPAAATGALLNSWSHDPESQDVRVIMMLCCACGAAVRSVSAQGRSFAGQHRIEEATAGPSAAATAPGHPHVPPTVGPAAPELLQSPAADEAAHSCDAATSAAAAPPAIVPHVVDCGDDITGLSDIILHIAHKGNLTQGVTDMVRQAVNIARSTGHPGAPRPVRMQDLEARKASVEKEHGVAFKTLKVILPKFEASSQPVSVTVYMRDLGEAISQALSSGVTAEDVFWQPSETYVSDDGRCTDFCNGTFMRDARQVCTAIVEPCREACTAGATARLEHSAPWMSVCRCKGVQLAHLHVGLQHSHDVVQARQGGWADLPAAIGLFRLMVFLALYADGSLLTKGTPRCVGSALRRSCARIALVRPSRSCTLLIARDCSSMKRAHCGDVVNVANEIRLTRCIHAWFTSDPHAGLCTPSCFP